MALLLCAGSTVGRSSASDETVDFVLPADADSWRDAVRSARGTVLGFDHALGRIKARLSSGDALPEGSTPVDGSDQAPPFRVGTDYEFVLQARPDVDVRQELALLSVDAGPVRRANGAWLLRPRRALTFDEIRVLGDRLGRLTPSLGVTAARRTRPDDISDEPGKKGPPYPKSGYGLRVPNAPLPLARRVVVAVIDRGVDHSHPCFASTAITEIDLYPQEPSDTATQEHGTAMASLILGQEGERYRGIAAGVELVSIRFRDLKYEAVAEAIHRAVNEQAAVISLSYSLERMDPVSSALIADALKRVKQSGAVLVCAAGNRGDDVDQFPTGTALSNLESDHKIVVAACSLEGELLSHSAYGARCVHFAAPGKNVWHAYPGQGQYAQEAGTSTSVATAMTAGAIASVLATGLAPTPREALAYVVSEAREHPSLAGKCVTGRYLSFWNRPPP